MTHREYRKCKMHWSVIDESLRLDDGGTARRHSLLNQIGSWRRTFGKGACLEALWRIYRHVTC